MTKKTVMTVEVTRDTRNFLVEQGKRLGHKSTGAFHNWILETVIKQGALDKLQPPVMIDPKDLPEAA